MRTLLEYFKAAVLIALPRVLPQKLYVKFTEQLGREANLDLSVTRTKQLAMYSGASMVGRDRLLSSLFEVYYSGGDPNNIVPADDIAQVASFVPYYRGFTSVVLYNFFKSNYGIRDPILYRISIFHGRNVVWCKQVLLSADTVFNIQDPALTVSSLPEHGTLAIQAFHPRISSIPAKELRYFGIYRDSEHGIVAGGHSLGLSREKLPQLTQPAFRGFGYCDSLYFHSSASQNRIPLIPGEDDSAGMLRKLHSNTGVNSHGYMVRESPSGCPTTIWHDGPVHRDVSAVDAVKKGGAICAAFFIPDFEVHAPLILISKNEIGFLPRWILIHLMTEGGVPIARKQVAIDSSNATVDLREEFSDQNLAGSINVLIEFDREIHEFKSQPTSYVHLYYRSPEGLGDQVHSHTSLGYYEDPFRQPRSYRCRKFAPFLNDPQLQFIYSIINLGPGARPLHDNSIRLRIFTDAGAEFVVNRKLNAAGITNIRGTELFASLAVDAISVAVVQFEHETTNFAGSWFALDRVSGHLGVDHFTGG